MRIERYDHLRRALRRLLGKKPREIHPSDSNADVFSNPLVMDAQGYDQRDQLVLVAVWVGRHLEADPDGGTFGEKRLRFLWKDCIPHTFVEVGSFRSIMLLAGFAPLDPMAEEWTYAVRFASEPKWGSKAVKHVRFMRQQARISG